MRAQEVVSGSQGMRGSREGRRERRCRDWRQAAAPPMAAPRLPALLLAGTSTALQHCPACYLAGTPCGGRPPVRPPQLVLLAGAGALVADRLFSPPPLSAPSCRSGPAGCPSHAPRLPPLLTPFPVACIVRPSSQAQLAAIPKRIRPEGLDAEAAAQAAVSAAQGLDAKFGELRKAAKAAYDRIYYGDVLPPVGSYQISYARWVAGCREAGHAGVGWKAGRQRACRAGWCQPQPAQKRLLPAVQPVAAAAPDPSCRRAALPAVVQAAADAARAAGEADCAAERRAHRDRGGAGGEHGNRFHDAGVRPAGPQVGAVHAVRAVVVEAPVEHTERDS